MTTSEINNLWAKLIIEELTRLGVTRFYISPGSRSTPLVLEVAENSNTESIVHYDERGAAFCALGFAKATGVPAALICTSGTALANYFPAVVEASRSCTPMIILSADRPVELRDCGASQTIDQVKIFGDYSRWSFDLPTPDERIDAAFVLTTVDQLCYRARRSPEGPAQLNCPFREPIVPTEEKSNWSEYLSSIARWQKSDEPYTTYSLPSVQPLQSQIEKLYVEMEQSRRGIIVAGVLRSYCDASPLITLAEKLGWPLLADINSGIRTSGKESTNIVGYYDLYLRNENFRKKFPPDFVLHFGEEPISKSLSRFLTESGAKYALVNNNPFRQDPYHKGGMRFEFDPISFAETLADKTGTIPSALREIFRSADAIAERVIDQHLETLSDEITEYGIAREIFRSANLSRGIFLATSMPIREADTFAPWTMARLIVGANRGVNGIDGTVATAVGFAAGLKLPTTLLIGDLALLHDLNSLALVRTAPYPMTIVVINNDGGGIFSFLPIAKEEDHFEKFFGTPHGVTFKHAAEQFGLRYEQPSSPAEFKEVYARMSVEKESTLIEVRPDRKKNLLRHRAIWEAVAAEIGG